MEFSIASQIQNRKQSELLVLPFWKEKKKVHPASEMSLINSLIKLPLASGDFKGNEGEVLFLYVSGQKENRFALLGLGEKEKLTTENLRRAYASVTKACNQRGITEINLLVPQIPALAEENVLRGLVEGLMLPNYSFDKHKHDSIKEKPSSHLKKAALIGVEKGALEIARRLAVIGQAVYFARDLTNTNADEVNPQHLEQTALKLAKDLPHVKATLLDKKRIEKEKMGLLLAVNRGSSTDPAFIILEYKGNPKAKDHTVLIGKGITYDTGGLSIKVSGMETMKADMGGAAVVLATLYAAATLALPIHLTVVIPATENCVSANSYKPGDVYSSMTGKTVEVANTDAEGRLVLADALAYANKYLKPTRIIDFATLTGGIEIALGSEAIGMMSNNDALADLFIRAGSETFERVWRLPLFEEYKENLKSEVADIKNVGTRSASSIIGGIFLQYFVDKTPWVHFDIASTAYINEAKRYHPKFATGIGVRLMMEFLQNI